MTKFLILGLPTNIEQECILQEYSLSDTMPESNFERNNSQSFRSLLKSRLH